MYLAPTTLETPLKPAIYVAYSIVGAKNGCCLLVPNDKTVLFFDAILTLIDFEAIPE